MCNCGSHCEDIYVVNSRNKQDKLEMSEIVHFNDQYKQ